MNLQERMLRSITQRKGNVVIRADLGEFGSASQVTRALNALLKKGVLVRIGRGVYAKTRKSSVTGALIPAGSLESLAVETFRKLGVSVLPGKAAQAYNSRETTQLPGIFVVNTGRRRIARQIAVGGRKVVYENDYGRSKTTI